MLTIHSVTVLCVSQLPETKGIHMGRISTIGDYDDDVDGATTKDEHDNELDGTLIT